MESYIAAELKAPSKTEQRQFLSLYNNFSGKYPFSGIVKTNALPCGLEYPIGGVYPTICVINHSCLPNAHNAGIAIQSAKPSTQSASLNKERRLPFLTTRAARLARAVSI
jgi:hypothetical protein